MRDRPRPHITVVLCTWNGARWLDGMLGSLATQSRLPDRVVVNDDASSDATSDLLRDFAARAPFPFDVEVNATRLGSTRNFERALARASGDLIALADQDDVWHGRKLARLAGILDDDPIVSLAFSDADLIDGHDHLSTRTLWEARRVARYLRKHEIVPAQVLARRGPATGCTMVLRHRAVEAALPFPEVLDDPDAPMRHDRWLSLIAPLVGTVAAVPETLLSFRVHPDQETGVLGRGGCARQVWEQARSAAIDDDLAFVRHHTVRAEQLAQAAGRAEEVGDFDAEDALRRASDHHRFRAGRGPTARRLRDVAEGLWSGGYAMSASGIGSALADTARSGRHHSRPGDDP